MLDRAGHALPDMLGLGSFAAVGVDMAAEQGLPALICVMMGVITGVFGGVLRDDVWRNPAGLS